ncbi:hypothetical protein G7Y89_g6349 [Cudoniella acicularis]|uniref:Uncharacterized protein n=1 Tax=Cudoniella acicularis TaxID=354080 RepID=A0A8H4W5L5_9HELO|nr:hypothetical protein G7Y89_g6349 [Cudoniella acicularis]
MAQNMQYRQPSSYDNREKNFFLTPAIFTSFDGLPPGPQPVLDQTEKLQKILENLRSQQDAVRLNMLFLAQQEAENAVTRAREELDALERKDEEGSSDYDVERETEIDAEERRKRDAMKKDVEAMLWRMKTPRRENANSGDYEMKPDEFDIQKSHQPSPGGNQSAGVQKGGTRATSKPRTATYIREELSQYLRYLVNETSVEMEAYDAHGKQFASTYEHALGRRMSKPAPIPVSQPPVSAPVANMGSLSMAPPRGILKNSGGDIPLSIDPSRRMSAGTIFAMNSPTTIKTVRTYESMEDVARRGSK